MTKTFVLTLLLCTAVSRQMENVIGWSTCDQLLSLLIILHLIPRHNGTLSRHQTPARMSHGNNAKFLKQFHCSWEPRSSGFITRRLVVIYYRRLGFLNPEDGTDKLSLNFSKKSPLLAA